MADRNTIEFDDHGCYAKIGDYVEVIDHSGNLTGIRGIVYEVVHRGADIMDDRRYLRFGPHDAAHLYHDAMVRIVSKASDR